MVHYLVQSYIPSYNPNTQADVFANADVLCATVVDASMKTSVVEAAPKC